MELLISSIRELRFELGNECVYVFRPALEMFGEWGESESLVAEMVDGVENVGGYGLQIGFLTFIISRLVAVGSTFS